jgi:antitoxin YefM
MDTLSYSAFRSQLAGTLDKVNDDHKPILITRQNGKPAVVMSLEDFQAYEETAYLMASPKNAERLNKAIAEIEAGRVVNKELIEE